MSNVFLHLECRLSGIQFFGPNVLFAGSCLRVCGGWNMHLSLLFAGRKKVAYTYEEQGRF